MTQKEIVLWLDQRWYDALSRHLGDETLEDHLEEVIDRLCNDLPESEYKRISEAIWQEKQDARQAAEAARRFAVFHVTEGDDSLYFIAEEDIDMLHVATRLRSYIRKQGKNIPERFTGMFTRGERIEQEQFKTFTAERMENTGRVTGAFDIDLDEGTFDALHIMDGWQRFQIKDVSTAAYFANKKTGASWDDRWRVFLDRLDGKQITQNIE